MKETPTTTWPEIAFGCADSSRLVASRFPPVSLYDRVADPADLDTVFAIEMLTNPRLRQEVGELSIVPQDERISGPGTTAVMAAFTHLNPEGSRFSDGSFGVYYAAIALETAIAEVSHHRSVFLKRTQEPAIEVDLRNYRATIAAHLTDVRGAAPLHDPEDYAAPQALARQLVASGRDGVIYDSVRHPGGTCVALFRPKAVVPPVRQAEHISLVWDGHRISGWYQKSEHHWLLDKPR